MDLFQSIEAKISQFAKAYKAEVYVDSLLLNGLTPVSVKGRNIFWSDGEIGKGILIQPALTHTGKVTGLWNFELYAWLNDGKRSDNKPFWEKRILKSVEFGEIEKGIDALLHQAITTLKSINKENLRKAKV